MKQLTVLAPPEEMGPAMAALTERQRKFVEVLVTQTRQNLTEAAKLAGYSDTGSSAHAQGNALSRHPKVLKAIHEEAEKRIRSGGVLAANVLIGIAGDPLHKDRLKAAQALLASGGLGPIALNRTTVEHTISDEAMLARVNVLAGLLGVEPAKLLGRVRGLPSRAVQSPGEPVRDNAEDQGEIYKGRTGEILEAEFEELTEWDEVIDAPTTEATVDAEAAGPESKAPWPHPAKRGPNVQGNRIPEESSEDL